MKTTTFIADIATITVLGYLLLNDGTTIEYVLFAIMLMANIIKWITTPRKER